MPSEIVQLIESILTSEAPDGWEVIDGKSEAESKVDEKPVGDALHIPYRGCKRWIVREEDQTEAGIWRDFFIALSPDESILMVQYGNSDAGVGRFGATNEAFWLQGQEPAKLERALAEEIGWIFENRNPNEYGYT